MSIGRTYKRKEASPIHKTDYATTEKERAENVGRSMLSAARVFANGKYRSLLGNFPSRIASNAENSLISQSSCTSLDSPKPTARAVQKNNQPLFHKLKKKGKIYGICSIAHGKGAWFRQRNDRPHRAFHHTEER